MDHLNLAIDISHGWINGVVELYLLVLIWVLFNIHASASGGWPGGKRFALFPSFQRDSVSQTRSWDTVTYHEMASLKALTQETEGQEIRRMLRIPHMGGVFAEKPTNPFQTWEVTREQEGTLRRVSLGHSEAILEIAYQFFVFSVAREKVRGPLFWLLRLLFSVQRDSHASKK